MPSTLEPKPGFDWSRVKWSPARAVIGDGCSYCGVEMDEDRNVPLMMWRQDGSMAQFCDACQLTWFGIETFPDLDEEED
jgi:hypothetical protein